MYAVIRDTNGSNQPGLFCFDECTPGAVAGLLTTVWGMDEVSIKGTLLDAEVFSEILSNFGNPVSLASSIS